MKLVWRNNLIFRISDVIQILNLLTLEYAHPAARVADNTLYYELIDSLREILTIKNE